MKILFVLGFSNPFAGAGWTRIEFFAKDWSRRGHIVEVLGAFSYRSLQKMGFRKSDKVNIYNLIFIMGLNHPVIFALNSIISFMVSTLFLIARKPNVVIVSFPSGDVGLGALMACKLVRAKCVVDYRDEWEDYAISLGNSRIVESFYSAIKMIMSYLYMRCLLTVGVTANYVASLKLRGLYNVKLVPNGADTKTFKPLINNGENKNFTIFYSGAIGGYYRLDIVVKALKKLIDRGLKNVKLVIAGRGEVQNMHNLILEMGVSRYVIYKGAINDKVKLAELIAEADIGLIPYDDNILWKNSLPAKFFEYCACGLPVVATAYEDSILAKLIKKHGLGLVVTPMDEEKLAESIYRIYENNSFRAAPGRRGRTLIEEKYDRNKISNIFLNLVEQVVYNSV